MGNEMGNNNVIGQQVPEESAKDFDKTMANADYSHELNNINGEKDMEKDGIKDVDMPEVLKVPLISSGGDKQMASDQTKLSAVNEDLDEKNRGLPLDHTSTEDDDENDNLHTEQDKEKDGTKDVDMSEVLKAPVVSNGGDDQMASDQTKMSAAVEDLDKKNRGSLEDHTSTQDDDGNSNLPTEQGDETQEDSGTETATNSAETVAHVGTTTEDITSNTDSSPSDEQFTQLEHETTEKNEENTTANPAMLLDEAIEGLPEDEEESSSQEAAVVGDNVVGEDTVENLEGQTGASTVEDLRTPQSVQGEITSSTESIISGYLDGQSKEVVVEDEPIERDNSSHVRPEDDSNQETSKNEDLDEKSRDSLQDHTSTEDDGDSTLPTEQGDESQENSGTETTTDGTEKVASVSTTTEDMTSSNDTSSSDEEMTETSEESTIPNPLTLLEGITVSAPQDGEEYCSQEAAVVGDNLVGEDTVESLEERQDGVSAVEDLWTPSSVQGETTSSTESIITDHLDDESKEFVLEDEPRERGNSSHVRPEDDTNQETSKNEEKQEIFEIGNNNTCKTRTVDTVVENDEVLEEDKKIQGLENQQEEFPKCSAYGALDIVEAVSQFQSALADPSATNGKEFQKHELSIAEQMLDSVSAAMEHNVIETADKEQGGIVKKYVADNNEQDNFEGDKKSDGIHDSLGLVKVHGEDFTGLGPPLSGPLPILNEEKVHEEVIIEELAAPMTSTSFALQPVEDFAKEGTKPDSSDSNEGTTTSTYEAKTIDTQETMSISQCDQPQQVLVEEPEVVKFENSETPSTCIQLVEYSSATELIFPTVFNKEREGIFDKATCFTSESNQEKVTGTAGFAAESEQKKVIANADNSSEEQCLLQKPTLGTDVGEETPLLLSTESIDSLSYSSEQHSKVVKDIPMTNITLMKAKDEAVEESEKSPLLSPREPSEGAFRAPNHSARNNKPLRSLMTEDGVGMWSPLKEQEPVRKNSTTVSSPRSKEKQKPKSSLFAICMCCTTATN
ncbi:hypothetical protein D1007_19003 [Hordeum vulgare]|nr:hypothetical protein D1007_19003 [Hordeum vulgare]